MASEDEAPELESDEEIRAALTALRGDEPSLRDILCLVNASYERRLDLVPRAVIEAVEAKWATDRDFANGGADQFAWNHGVETTRA